MRWQTTAVLAVLLVAVGTFYYVYELRLGPEREKAAAAKGRVFAAETADVTALELRRGTEVVSLKREGDTWQMREPVKARADRAAVEEVLTSVVMTRSDREVAAAPPSLADFGLDKPAAVVTITLKDGKQLGLELGANTPTGVWVYARDRSKPAVLAVAEGVLRDATRAVADLRDKTVLAFQRADVTGVDVVTREETLAVEPAGDNRWKLTRPVALAADTDTITDLLDKLAAAKVKQFVAEAPRSLEPYGLERPVRLAVHTGKDKDRATRTLHLGRVDPDKKGVYAMRPGESSVLLVPEDVWAALPGNVAAIRNKVLVQVDRDKVTKLELASPRGTVTVAKEGDRWRITAPEALPADPVEVGAVLFKLRDLRAQAFLSDDASGIGRYLARPEVRVSVTTADAKEPLTVLLAPSPEKRGGQPSAYAAVAGQGPVVLVDGKALAELGRSVTELRDRTLVSGLEPRNVKRVRFRAGGQAILVERSGDTDWKVLEPAKGPARGSKVEEILYMLRGLKWKEVAAPAADDPARYGLDAAALEVALYATDGAELGTVVIGKRERGVAYVKTGRAPAVYTVDAGTLGVLPKIPDDLKG